METPQIFIDNLRSATIDVITAFANSLKPFGMLNPAGGCNITLSRSPMMTQILADTNAEATVRTRLGKYCITMEQYRELVTPELTTKFKISVNSKLYRPDAGIAGATVKMRDLITLPYMLDVIANVDRRASLDANTLRDDSGRVLILDMVDLAVLYADKLIAESPTVFAAYIDAKMDAVSGVYINIEAYKGLMTKYLDSVPLIDVNANMGSLQTTSNLPTELKVFTQDAPVYAAENNVRAPITNAPVFVASGNTHVATSNTPPAKITDPVIAAAAAMVAPTSNVAASPVANSPMWMYALIILCIAIAIILAVKYKKSKPAVGGRGVRFGGETIIISEGDAVSAYA